LCRSSELAFSCKAVLYPGAERDLFECSRCRSCLFWPIPSPEDIARCYPHAYFQDFLKHYWKDYYKGRALIRSIQRWRPSGVFLDAGCALGTLLAGVRDFSSWKVLGLEYSPIAAEAGRALNKMEIACAGLCQAPYAPESVDYVHANNVLEHEFDPAAALSAAARLLKPGGRLHLVLPNGRVDVLPNQKLYRTYHRAFPTRHSGHLFFYTPEALRLLLERAGLRVRWIKNFHFKTALKAHGLTPGAYKHFFENGTPPATEKTNGGGLETIKAQIPPRRSWPAFYFTYWTRRLMRLRGLTWGYDFEILAEK
jgi:SAM-dependent methyltransferase